MDINNFEELTQGDGKKNLPVVQNYIRGKECVKAVDSSFLVI